MEYLYLFVERHTVKFLIATTPDGALAYISKAYPGSTSDKELLLACNFCSDVGLQPGDNIMVDKGFDIHDVVPEGT